MPKCDKCQSLLPPDFLFDITEEGGKECWFCRTGKSKLSTKPGENYTKEQCIKDYDIFLKKLKEKPKIAEYLAKKN